MNGKYITTQIRITSLSHRNQKKSLEPKEEKLADLSKFVTIWKRGKQGRKKCRCRVNFKKT